MSARSFPVIINESTVSAVPNRTILELCRANSIPLPTLCEFEGLSKVGACRLCLVEIEGSPRPAAACATAALPNMKIKTESERLRKYRKMTLELLFAERNHVCAACVANRRCRLQELASEAGMDHVRFPYIFPKCEPDTSHPFFVLDQNRCILCSRCVRVCDELEGAHNWDVSGRGCDSRIIADFDMPWKDSSTCTSCGKCVMVCPTGALWSKKDLSGFMLKDSRNLLALLERKENSQ